MVLNETSRIRRVIGQGVYHWRNRAILEGIRRIPIQVSVRALNRDAGITVLTIARFDPDQATCESTLPVV